METEKLVIIGSGPAGLTAAIYAARSNLNPLVIAGREAGGQLMLTTDVDDFPGFDQTIQGPELMSKMKAQAEKFETRFINEDVISVDFSVTPYSLVTCNNAGTNPPSPDGWAQGLVRTYKINLTSGTAKKGQFFYVGGNKNIWGLNSTDISAANWISSTQYSSINGADFGAATANLLANSGNVAGIAVFDGITVSAASVPLDVVMYGGAGAVYSTGPPEIGYRITNTDYYSTINALTRQNQAFYAGGTNTAKLTLPATGNFTKLGGVYDALTGRWTTGRTVTSIPLTLTSPLTIIEAGDGFTTIQN